MMDIESLIKKYADRYRWSATGTTVKAMRAALTEADAAMAMEHNFKMLQVEATVRNLVERIRQLEAHPVGGCALPSKSTKEGE